MSRAPRSSRGIAALHLAGALLTVATIEDPVAVTRADGEPGTAEATQEARHPKAGRLRWGDLRPWRERPAVEHRRCRDDGHDRLALRTVHGLLSPEDEAFRVERQRSIDRPQLRLPRRRRPAWPDCRDLPALGRLARGRSRNLAADVDLPHRA